MFGKRRAESVDNADGKFTGSQVCKKGGFHMRSLRALRIVGIGLAFAAILASGGLPVGSQSGQEGQSALMVTLSYPDNKVAFVDLRFAPDGKLIDRKVTTVDVPQGPSGLDISPDGLFTYVVSFDASALAVLDNEARQLIKTVSLGFEVNPYAVAFRPDGQVAYTVNGGTRNITVIDAINHAVLTNIALPGARSPRGLDFHPDGKLAYVSDTETDTVWVLDAVSHRLQETLRTGGQCSAYVKASNSGKWVYVSDRCLSRIYAYETATKTITPIQLSGNSGAWFIAFDPEDRVAFVSQIDPRRNTYSGKISIIDVAQKKEIGTIDVGQGAATTAALEGLQPRYAPAGLEVLSLPGELLSLIVFPWLAETPILAVPFNIAPTGVQSNPPIPIPPVLTRTIQGMISTNCCEKADQGLKDAKTEFHRSGKTLTVKITITFTYSFECLERDKGRCKGAIKLKDPTVEAKKIDKDGKEKGGAKVEEKILDAIQPVGTKPEGIDISGVTITCNRKCDGKTTEGTASVTIRVKFGDIREDEHVKGKVSIKVQPEDCEIGPSSTYEVEFDSSKQK
jgi:6-phosphogluconolactonase (cycloisomerase 2 family)